MVSIRFNPSAQWRWWRDQIGDRKNDRIISRWISTKDLVSKTNGLKLPAMTPKSNLKGDCNNPGNHLCLSRLKKCNSRRNGSLSSKLRNAWRVILLKMRTKNFSVVISFELQHVLNSRCNRNYKRHWEKIQKILSRLRSNSSSFVLWNTQRRCNNLKVWTYYEVRIKHDVSRWGLNGPIGRERHYRNW